jgi:peptidylprolyl isomerase/FKBP-type peptidyl-prolyl cis-trans isomerase FklB
MSSRAASLVLAACAVLSLTACKKQDAADRAQAQAASSASPIPADQQAFLARNAKEQGVTVLPDGLQYKVVRSGAATGPRPKVGDEVKVHYEGTFIDGKVFDSSYQGGQPVVFTVGEVVPGWNEVLQLMRPGDVWYVYLPPKLGYGERGAGDGAIPPNSVLVFKIELLGVLPHGGAAANLG